MNTLLALTYALATGPAVSLDSLAIADAVALDGRAVWATIGVGQPVQVLGGWTVAGREVGGVEVAVRVPADADIDRGDVVTVAGMLKVVAIPPAVVDGKHVAGAVSVLVTGVRVK